MGVLGGRRDEGQMVKFCFLIRIRKTFEVVGFCLVCYSWSFVFSGMAESPVKQARLLGPVLTGLPSYPVTVSASFTFVS